MRKKLEEERVKILQEINERKKSSESKEEPNEFTEDDHNASDTPGQLRRRNVTIYGNFDINGASSLQEWLLKL
jgi:hypothetical protein